MTPSELASLPEVDAALVRYSEALRWCALDLRTHREALIAAIRDGVLAATKNCPDCVYCSRHRQRGDTAV